MKILSTLVFFPEHLMGAIKKSLHKELADLKQFNYSISEMYSLPIGLRKQHIGWINDRLEREAKEIEKAKSK